MEGLFLSSATGHVETRLQAYLCHRYDEMSSEEISGYQRADWAIQVFYLASAETLPPEHMIYRL